MLTMPKGARKVWFNSNPPLTRMAGARIKPKNPYATAVYFSALSGAKFFSRNDAGDLIEHLIADREAKLNSMPMKIKRNTLKWEREISTFFSESAW